MFKKSIRILFAVGILLYIILGIFAINLVTSHMSENYYSLLGTKALDIAKIATNKFTITDAEFAELKTLTFEEALLHPANVRFSDIFGGSEFSSDFKYAYVMTSLSREEIKYHVTEETASYYDTQAGQPLDLLWLLDVIINPKQKTEVNKTQHYYEDMHRYSYIRESDIPFFDDKKSGYNISKDEYGDSFTGMVPLYTVEGNFVGLVGVDIYYENYKVYYNNIQISLIIIFLLPSILLTIIFLIIYIKNSKNISKDANTDPLTSLYNRRYLNTTLPKLVSDSYNRKTPLSLIMIDIDYFKNYNDNYGHQMGDEVIVCVSNTIVSSLRRKVDIVCRYGGEEILVLLPNTDLSGAKIVASKIQDAINQVSIAHLFSPVSKIITVSQGIYSDIAKNVGKSCENTYIVNADKALYKAKQSGRNNHLAFNELQD